MSVKAHAYVKTYNRDGYICYNISFDSKILYVIIYNL